MMTIKCARCKQKIFRYVKIGKGKLWHCWKDRIVEDLSVHDEKTVKCNCGNIIGIDENKWIKLKQQSIQISGTKTK
jgi:acetone carboxylase gamma subunit